MGIPQAAHAPLAAGQHLNTSKHQPSGLAESGHHNSFAAALMGQRASAGARLADVREAAEHLVSSAFITPMLGAMRESSRAAGPFAPGSVERRFGPLFDREIADRVTQASGFGIVDAIVARYAPQDRPGAMQRSER